MPDSLLKVLLEAGVRFPVMQPEQADKVVAQLLSADVIDAGQAARLGEALTAGKEGVAVSPVDQLSGLGEAEIARLHERMDRLEELLSAISEHLGVALDGSSERGRSSGSSRGAAADSGAPAERVSVVDELLELADLADIFFG